MQKGQVLFIIDIYKKPGDKYFLLELRHVKNDKPLWSSKKQFEISTP